jgi:hypothetical protein
MKKKPELHSYTDWYTRTFDEMLVELKRLNPLIETTNDIRFRGIHLQELIHRGEKLK